MGKIAAVTFLVFVVAILLTSLVDSIHDKQYIDYERYDFWMKILSIIGVVSFLTTIVAIIVGLFV